GVTGVTRVPQSKRVSVTSGAACADADRLIKALAQAPIASKDRVRFMVSSQNWRQISNLGTAADVARLYEPGQCTRTTRQAWKAAYPLVEVLILAGSRRLK